MRRAADFIIMRGGRLYRNLGGLIFFVYKMCHYAFAHCAAADVAVADEKYFYHVAKTSVNA